MFTKSMFRDLYGHMEWADAAVWRAVLACDSARIDENILARLRHIHRTQQFFLKVWRAEALDYAQQNLPMEAELGGARKYYEEVREVLLARSDEELSRELNVPWADHFAKLVGRDVASRTTFGETAFQVTSHSTYHRGQVNTRLRELGGEPPLVDYIAWLWLGRPAPAWPDL